MGRTAYQPNIVEVMALLLEHLMNLINQQI